MEVITGYCQICDAEIKATVPTGIPIEISLEASPHYNPYVNITLVRKQILCDDCKQILKKIMGK